MNTILHAAEQALGWVIGSIGALATAVTVPRLIKGFFTHSFSGLSRERQHKLFQGYWNHLEKKERYEELEALEPVMLAYQEGKQPTRKQLKPYKLVVKKRLSLKGDDFKFITTRRITKAES